MYLPPLVGEVPPVLSECPVRVAVAVAVGDRCNNGDRAPADKIWLELWQDSPPYIQLQVY